MPKRAVRNSKRAMSFLSFLIALAVLAAMGLVCAIAIQRRLRPVRNETSPSNPGNSFVDVNDLPETEIVLKAATYQEPENVRLTLEPGQTPSPAPTPTEAPTPDPSDPYAQLRPLPQNEDMLPIFKKAFTDQKVIAITLEECSGATITAKFASLARQYGAKLTLFPTGENVMKNGMADVLRKCVFELGFEIENRGYSPFTKLYQAPDMVMVREIWQQSIAVSFVLGQKYEPHFFRMYGGMGENDRRTHAYLKQQGYKGIAHWTWSCTGMNRFKMIGRLAPGCIYSFRSTNDDLSLMAALMSAAQKNGYRMVTMNELFGYEANRTEAVQTSILQETMPPFSYDASASYDLYPGEASWAVYNMQSRLASLGYMHIDDVDGIFGEGTSDAVRLFQAQIQRPATGAGDVATLESLYASDAPANPNPLVEAVPTSASGGLPEEKALIPIEIKPAEETPSTPVPITVITE